MSGKRAEKRAYSYLRFSTPEQRKGDSKRRQRELTQKWCEKNGITLDDSLRDEGVSGWKGKNAELGALARFLDAVKRKKVPQGSFLIIEHIDRLTRQRVRKALSLWLSILDAGITIVTVDPERVYPPSSADDPLGLIEPIIYFAVNNEKSERLSDSLKEAWADKRKHRKPLTGWCPAWVKLSEDGERYELIPQKAKIVKQIVALALDGFGDIKICQKLNKEKVPVISDNATWTTAYVSKILRTPALIGSYTPGTHHWETVETKGEKHERRKRRLTGEVWEGYFPRLITDEQWTRLRAMRLLKTKNGGKTGENVANLFSSILFNARDGLRMQRIVKNHPRLISVAFRNGLEGDTQSFPYVPFEAAILNTLLAELKPADLFGESADEEEDRLAELSSKLTAIEARITILKSQMDGEDVEVLPVLIGKLKEWERKKADLLSELQHERATHISRGNEAEVLGDLQALVKNLAEGEELEDNRTKLKARLGQLVDSIWMVIHGAKRSKFKLAVFQVWFKAGGSKWGMVAVEGTEPNYFEGATSIIEKAKVDFRQFQENTKVQELHEQIGELFEKATGKLKEGRMKQAWAENNAKRKQAGTR